MTTNRNAHCGGDPQNWSWNRERIASRRLGRCLRTMFTKEVWQSRSPSVVVDHNNGSGCRGRDPSGNNSAARSVQAVAVIVRQRLKTKIEDMERRFEVVSVTNFYSSKVSLPSTVARKRPYYGLQSFKTPRLEINQ